VFSVVDQLPVVFFGYLFLEILEACAHWLAQVARSIPHNSQTVVNRAMRISASSADLFAFLVDWGVVCARDVLCIKQLLRVFQMAMLCPY
jgi:hypothetical protein